jgi:hypothetical protein
VELDMLQVETKPTDVSRTWRVNIDLFFGKASYSNNYKRSVAANDLEA